MMSTLNKTKKTRKPGSGRKRKIGAVTSQDYAEQLRQLEERDTLHMTPQQKEAFAKQKRSLKNRMSALKSRENKRTKLENLEQTVQRLQREIEKLAKENQSLRESRSCAATTENTCDIPRRKRNRTAPKSNNISNKKVHSLPSPQSPSSDYFEVEEISTLVNPCTHNCESAVLTARSSHTSCVTGQYSHLLWEMPWKTLRSIFSTLWIISKALIAAKTTKDFLQTTATYRQTQRTLRQLFSKILISSPHCNLFRHYEKQVKIANAKGSTLQQQAFSIFDRICQKFLIKAVMSVRA